MVAKSFLGFSNNSKTRAFFLLFSFNSSLSDGERLKKATSDPEIRADINSNIAMVISNEITFNVMGRNVIPIKEFKSKLYGSGSSNILV